MKMVIAIIRHEHLQAVQDVLDECGVSGVTVTEVKGCGAQRGYTERYRGTSVNISLRPRLKVEAVMRQEIVPVVVDKMAGAARTGESGEVGDGKIFVIDVEDAVRIRTGEHGAATVQHQQREMWGH
ncbi:MAG: P-II family nitrogen regulator [Candidatus Dormibacteraeota bacterium]|uniref:P-II family nitrogen regulator n=2 Tax=Candidatus Dormiibacter inghamiae TaxID=3127013 RepID=A0A934NC75_9BACT|nr:P-II family nitrogen regulator [Candidatus Dormibacteraeota bacterium]MBJ7605889.1 P-II family nitrogen regulator [Candidatus Dormibacteraeota bacterium]